MDFYNRANLGHVFVNILNVEKKIQGLELN